MQRWNDWSLRRFIDLSAYEGLTKHMQYTDNVIGPGSPRYDNAYFQINYVRVYVVDGIASSVSSSLHPTSTGTSKPASTSTSTSTSPKSGSNTSGVLNASSSLYLFVLLFVGALAILI